MSRLRKPRATKTRSAKKRGAKPRVTKTRSARKTRVAKKRVAKSRRAVAATRTRGALVHLIDTHIYIFRAWSVLPTMPAPDGRATGAAYGFANTLIHYLRESDATHVACCADAGVRNFRHRRFPDYQKSRGTEPPPELAPQFALARRAARALGLAWFDARDYEADDVIATLTTKLYAEGARVRIVSADKDLMQLITEDGRVTLYDLQRKKHYDADGVRAKFGVAPAQIPDYLALLGDAVDDLPGVRGFGKKSAALTLQTFGTLDALPTDARAGDWQTLPLRGAAKLAHNFSAARAQALEIRELATLIRAVPGVRARADDLLWRGVTPARINALCAQLGWNHIRARAQSLIR